MHSFFFPLALGIVGIYLFWSGAFAPSAINSEAVAHLNQTYLWPNEERIPPMRVILIVLDAFRWDYTFNRFPFFQKMIESAPYHSRLLKLMSGDPTMTVERIKVMMTGNQATDTSVFENFVVSKTRVDNIVDKIPSSRKIVMGDDSWTKMFDLGEAINCASFDVADIDSCDQIVIQNLEQKYLQDRHSLLIGHMLGIDHVGHTFSSVGNDHMKQKLDSISNYLQKLTKSIKNDTILIVLGDHGMKDDGNHGGMNSLEVQTVLFAYTPEGLIQGDEANQSSRASQQDLASTLSILLDTSLPTLSLGQPITSILPIRFWKNLSEILRRNTQHLQNLLSSQKIKFQPQNYKAALSQLSSRSRDQSKMVFGIICIIASLWEIMEYLLKIFQGPQLVLILSMLGGAGSINYSWALLRHESSVLLVGIFGIALLHLFQKPLSRQKINQVTILVACLLLACQFQCDRTDEYQSNYLRLRILHNILNNYCLTIILRLGLVMVLFFSKSVSSHKFDLNLSTILSSVGLESVTEIFSPQFAPTIRCLVFVAYFSGAIMSKQHRQLRLICMLSMFGPPQTLSLLILSQIIATSSFQLLNTEKAHAFLIVYYRFFWLLLGLREQYSSIDIKQTFVFSSSFNLYLNGTCLIVMTLIPYIFGILLINRDPKSPYLAVKESKFQKDQSVNTDQLWLLFVAAGLLSTFISYYLNIGKILFTVTYSPMLVFNVCRSAALVGLLFLKKRLSMQQEPLKIQQDNNNQLDFIN